jgi:HD superfamily phosphohydrolase YqeK
MILHQKLSAAMAESLFQIRDPLILDAIRCHTTLRAGATALDQILFVADKVEWDQPDSPPYLNGLLKALEQSLEHAALYYLRYLWARRSSLQVVHPWLVEAYHDLSASQQPAAE